MKPRCWIKSFLSILLLSSVASISVRGKEPVSLLQEENRHVKITGDSFTIAVLPDTQFYCDTRLKLSAKWGNGDLRRYFFAQTEWVRDNQERLNIAFLVHERDIEHSDDQQECENDINAM